MKKRLLITVFCSFIFSISAVFAQDTYFLNATECSISVKPWIVDESDCAVSNGTAGTAVNIAPHDDYDFLQSAIGITEVYAGFEIVGVTGAYISRCGTTVYASGTINTCAPYDQELQYITYDFVEHYEFQ